MELNIKEKELEENLSVYTTDQNTLIKREIEKMNKIDKYSSELRKPYAFSESMDPKRMLEDFKRERHILEY